MAQSGAVDREYSCSPSPEFGGGDGEIRSWLSNLQAGKSVHSRFHSRR